jgi:hypothetical protein
MHSKFKKKNHQAYEDIQDGEKWKNWKTSFLGNSEQSIVNSIVNKYDLALSLGFDGALFFKSSNISIWPLVGTILNLEPAYRGKIFNVLPISIFFGNHPSLQILHMLLERPFSHLAQLGTEG